ncbi:hypothetical protein VI08_05955 [Luteibacter yeojuensis]|uniref:Uncharacterized protein n=1 Tax=Luteibacter yeojuensis TaxID=345309 RepID=A0A0F3L1I9_9GAMM|nr:hypothetical protein VI08_05955 [Luteibacter yeojuensis]
MEKAHYRYTAAEYNATADFVTVDDDAFWSHARPALHLRLPLSGAEDGKFMDDWFLFDQGSSEYIYLLNSTRRTTPSWAGRDAPHPDGPLYKLKKYYAWDKRHKLIVDVPRSGDSAPQYIFIPELQRLIPGISGTSPAPGMFMLDRCET